MLGVQLVDTVLLLCASPHVQNTEQEAVIESLRHLLAVQKDLGLPYSRDLSLVVLSLLFMLAKSSVEHEQLSILKLLLFLLKWKSENGISCSIFLVIALLHVSLSNIVVAYLLQSTWSVLLLLTPCFLLILAK